MKLLTKRVGKKERTAFIFMVRDFRFYQMIIGIHFRSLQEGVVKRKESLREKKMISCCLVLDIGDLKINDLGK